MPSREFLTDLARAQFLAQEIKPARAYTQFQYVDVTFNATANADTDIKHGLAAPTAEAIDYDVVRMKLTAAPGTVPIVYEDASATRRPWGAGYIILRSNLSSLQVTLRLTVRAANP